MLTITHIKSMIGFMTMKTFNKLLIFFSFFACNIICMEKYLNKDLEKELTKYYYEPFLLCQFDHKDVVVALTFSDKHLAFGGNNGEITILDMDANSKNYKKCIYKFDKNNNGYNDPIASLAYSSNGKYLASGSDDEKIKIWDAESYILLSKLSNCGRIIKIGFLPNCQHLISCEKDSANIKIWDIVTKNLLNTIEVNSNNTIHSFVFSSLGKFLLTSGMEINLWKVDRSSNDLKYIQTFDDNTDCEYGMAIRALSCSPDGRYLASSCGCEITIWKIDSKTKSISQIATAGIINGGHSKVIYALTFSPCGKYLSSASDDSVIKLWYFDRKSNILECTNTFDNTNSENKQLLPVLSYSSDGKLLASAGDGPILKIWKF